MHIQIEISHEFVLLNSGAERTGFCILFNLSETLHLYYPCSTFFFFYSQKLKEKICFHTGKILLVNKPPVIPLLYSHGNNISACISSIKILALGMQEMNTYMHTLYAKTEWKSKEIFLITNVRKSLNIIYCG